MTVRIQTRPLRFVLTLAVAAFALAAGAREAQAACFTTPLKVPVVQPRLQAQGNALAQLKSGQQLNAAATQSGASKSDRRDNDRKDPSFVGMWATEFHTGDGKLWDQGFELFHDDGTELAIDNAVPPSLGNVCVGVWKTTGNRTMRLRHMTFNWNPDGTLAGTFLLLVNARIDRNGDVYEGTFVSDSFDLNGDAIPALHAEGTVRGTRITVD